MKTIGTGDLNWLIGLAGHAISDGRGQADEAADMRHLDRLRAYAASGHDLPPVDDADAPEFAWETNAQGEPVMWLMSRDDGSYSLVPLYAFRRKALADKAKVLIGRAAGINVDVIPLPIED